MNSLKFHGQGTEYFKIWIVNILLTILTLGLYHPWAKVRTRRYFYGNTVYDNASFDYHATGKQLFLSYIVAMVIFALYVIFSQVNPTANLVVFGILFLAFPWIIWRGIRFNHRMSSYRNVRFGFNGSLGKSYLTFLAYPLGMMISFGILFGIMASAMSNPDSKPLIAGFMMILIVLAYPVFFALINKVSSDYFINGAHFGQEQFSGEFKFTSFLAIMVKGLLLGLLLSVITSLIVGVLAYTSIGLEGLSSLSSDMENMEQGVAPPAFFFIAIASIYALFIPISMYIIAYFKARHRSYIFSQMHLGHNINFDSSLTTNKYFFILLTNLLLLFLTMGLAYPWTKVRAHRYLTESVIINAPDGFAGYVSKHGKEGAFGEELSDAFDIDVGGIAF